MHKTFILRVLFSEKARGDTSTQLWEPRAQNPQALSPKKWQHLHWPCTFLVYGLRPISRPQNFLFLPLHFTFTLARSAAWMKFCRLNWKCRGLWVHGEFPVRGVSTDKSAHEACLWSPHLVRTVRFLMALSRCTVQTVYKIPEQGLGMEPWGWKAWTLLLLSEAVALCRLHAYLSVCFWWMMESVWGPGECVQCAGQSPGCRL